MQVGVAQEEWQWAVREEEVEAEGESSNWRKSSASRPARLKELSSTKFILGMGILKRKGCEQRVIK